MIEKAALIAAVRARLPELDAGRAAAIVDAIFAAITDLLARGEPVSVPGLGTLAVERHASLGRDEWTVSFQPNPLELANEMAEHQPENPTYHDKLALPAAEPPAPPPPPMAPAPAAPRPAAPAAPARPEAPPLSRGGGSYEAYGPAIPLRDPDEYVEGEVYAVVEVFYATDREPTGAGDPAEAYGRSRGDGSLHYGACRVSIPHDHRVGKLESPSLLRFELRPDPRKHVVLLDVETSDREGFFARLRDRVRASAGREVLVFVHGFNVSFADAARRTAQLAYDLQLDGAAGFYSWPSRGVPDLLGYTHDENSVQWTVPHLVAFLEELARDSGAERIHLIAHSMGNRALAAALQEIAWKLAAHPAPPSFAEVILTAPDIDAEVFRGLARAMRPTARRMTLYASGRDRALKVSHGIHGYGRAGDVEPEIVVVDGLDSIDASAVDTGLLGHSYFADQRSVISDIFYLVRDGLPPEKRHGLSPRQCKAGRFWAFAP
jgi:esterase/lipase superfamily enzyme/nucleoid DNA-binding protein